MKKLVEYKIKVPILVRLNSNITSANIVFDSKFGAKIDDAFKIVAFAEKNDFIVKGVSFHIGSGGEFSRNTAYKMAITNSLPVLEYLKSTPHFLENKTNPILDIGGGMLHDTDLEEALGWTKDLPYTMISELGRYFSEPAFHMAVQIVGKTERGVYLDNGVYHELNGYHRDHWHFPEITHVYDTDLETISNLEYKIKSKVFGPTCDSYDVIPDCELPLMAEVGDWIFMSNMGAYTSAGKVDFNGIKGASS
jgi:ornithine decarboxylase